MFDVTKIQTGLLGLVGIRQPLNPEFSILDAANIASRSGRYLDDIANYKTEYAIDTMDYKDATDAQVNDTFREIQKSAISTVCQQVFGDLNYIDRNFIYTQATTRQTPETTLVSGFVGFSIKPNPTKDVAFKITRIRLEFDGTYPFDLTVKLFNSNIDTPLQSKTVSITSNSQLEDFNWVVNNTDNDYKGEYYLGYIFDGKLTPYKRDYEASNVQNNISELQIEPSYVAGATGATIFNLEDVYYLSENTGLNPDITVYDDYTDLILQNQHLFGNAIQLQWAIIMMQRYIASTRSNRLERISKNLILMTITTIEGSGEGSPVRITGLNTLLSNEIIKIQKSIEELKAGYFGSGIQVDTLG
jgi:hypothetical protein